uniref:Ninja-family protein n=1 Tax=Kalanchoe fedtschenkoi TaxID=63787 RepID=A0A7N0U5V4_KALFE
MAGCEKEVEVELSLGLGNNFQRESAKSLRPGSVEVENGCGGGLSGCDSAEMMTAAADRTDEIVGEAALRRLEARKKQQVRRGVFRNGGERQVMKSDVGVVYVLDDDDDDDRVQKKTKADFSVGAATGRRGCEIDLNKSDHVGSDLAPRFPMQYFPNAKGQLYLASGSRELGSCGGYGGFRPRQAAEKSGLTMPNRKELEEIDGGAVKVGSCCSSAISENSRICSQGGSISSSDCGSLSSQLKAPRHKAQAVAAIVDQGPNEQIPSSGLYTAERLSISMPAAATANVTRQPLVASQDRPVLPCVSLAQMPRVSTTGPGGTTVKGFLYRCTREEVCIVCVCHGYSFSPAKFVEHAGGVDVENPLRHITVIPSAPATKF